MCKKKEKAVWLSFDLGVGGDYPGLYKWLDNHEAIECGDSVAFFKYSIDIDRENDVYDEVRKEIGQAVKLRPGDRMYIIRRMKASNGYSVKGDFMYGKRKAKPWEGYGDEDSDSSEEGE